MHSSPPETERPAHRRDNLLDVVEACTAEIRAHLAIFVIVFIPVLGFFYPTIVCAFAIYVSAHAVAQLPAPFDLAGTIVVANWSFLVSGCGIAIVVIFVLDIRRSLRAASAADRPSAKQMRAPKGAKGEILVQRLGFIWQHFPTAGRRAPSIVWYSNFNILAHAYDSAYGQIIEVSSGLWERIVHDDHVADAILAHESAHIVFHDPRVFRALASASGAVCRVLCLVTGIGLAGVALIAFSQLASDIAADVAVTETIRHICAIVIVSALILLALPLGVMMTRRYAGFICSLIEVRADVCAAVWTRGLEWFANALANDLTLRHFEAKDVGRSLFSPNLTHISETERVSLLRSTDRLITPKIRYFALSIALPFLLPVTAATYLIYGGAIDHILVTAITVVFQVATVAMIQIGSKAAVVSWRRACILAAAICFVQAMPRINLAPVGYIFTHYGVAVAVPGGFGSDEISFRQAIDDLGVTFFDVAGKIMTAVNRWSFTLSVVAACIAIRATSSLVRKHAIQSEEARLVALPVVLAALVSILSSYDHWRSDVFSVWPLSTSLTWFAWTSTVPWLRLCAPVIAAFLALRVQYAVPKCFMKLRPR